MVRADKEETVQYSAWDRAMENWNRLFYCLRDNVVIDPDQPRVLLDAELRALISTENQKPQVQRQFLTHGDIHAISTERAPAH